jgi:hypothetical protein
MANAKLDPEKIRSPIQLLAVWFAALVLLDGAFLTAAAAISTPAWVTPMLATAAVVFVPIFLVAAMLMQTKFRPHLQADQYYSNWNERREARERLVDHQVQLIRTEIGGSVANGVERRPKLERIERAVRAVEEISSLSSTQTKVLRILAEAPASFGEIRRQLRDRFGSETRPAAARNQLEELVARAIVLESRGDSEAKYDLTRTGRELVSGAETP